MELSIVTTLYRSAAHLDAFYERMRRAAEEITADFEILFVNDGSPDDSLTRALALQARDPRVIVVDLSRNFGHHKAMMTGLAQADGALIFLIDCDLEEDPELLAPFREQLCASGADVVFGVQQIRKGAWFERISGRIFYDLFNLLSDVPIPRNLLTVRLMTRRYVDALLEHRDRQAPIAGLWALTGFQQTPLAVTKHSSGRTSYGFRRKAMYLVDAVTSFSGKPLVMIFYLGCAISSLAFMAAGVLVVRRVFCGVFLEGWPSLIVSTWLLGGLTILCLGVIGLYLSKVFTETKRHPYTIIRHLYERNGESAPLLRESEGAREPVLHRQD